MNDRGDFLQQTDTEANFKNRFFPPVFLGLILFCSTLLPACGNGVNNNSLLSGNESLSGTDPTQLAPFAGGSFQIGWYFSDNTTVTLSDFQLEIKEVTQAQFQSVMGSNPSKFAGDDLPVERVTWQEASDYCTAIGRRLPTNAEWDYAARNGGTAPVDAYSTGNMTEPVACVEANRETCVGSTIAVGSYAPSNSGLYDMSGNVWEWVSDWGWDYIYNPDGTTDPTGPASGTERVNRGGGWYSNDPYRSEQASASPTGRNSSIGFRCAANADSGTPAASGTTGGSGTDEGTATGGAGGDSWIVGAWNISGSNNSGSSASGMMVFKSDYTYSNPYFFSSATSSGDKLVTGTWSYAGGILTYTRGDGECSGSAPEGSSSIAISCLYNWSWTLSR